MKILATVALLTLAPILAQAKATNVNCVDWHYVPHYQINIRTLSDAEREHTGASFGFELEVRADDGTESVISGVAEQVENLDSNALVFNLFQGVPYVRNPARKHGQVVVVLDSARTEISPTLTWRGDVTPLMKCTAN